MAKVGADDAAKLKELVFAVRLENATRYGSKQSYEPPVRPPVLTMKKYPDVFAAVLDPFFDEDEYMGTDELNPAMPIGDH